jgi:hypothetical protein
MKTVLTLTTVALFALPLLAGEPQKTADGKTAAAPATVTAPASTTDSPLVAAAKRSKAARKKPVGQVITDATLSKVGGKAHVTTSATNRPIVVLPPAPPSAEVVANQARIAEKAKQQKAAEDAAKRARVEELKKQRQESAAEESDSDYLSDVEAPVEQALPEGPKPTEQKPPHR